MRLPDFIWLNGDKIYPDINKSLPIDILLDRATSFGDGVFETMLVKNSKILFLELHLNRLFEGIKLLELDYDIKQIKNELNLSLSHLSPKLEYVLKFMVSRGGSIFGYGSKNIKSNSFIVADKIQLSNQSSIKLIRCNHKLSYMPCLSGLKHCNRLDQVIAKREVDFANVDDGVMLNQDGNVVETTSSNIFIFEGDKILTPQLDDCGVKGVTREILIKKIIPNLGLNISEQVISFERFLKCDGCFVTNSIQGIRSIEQIRFSNQVYSFPKNAIFRDIVSSYEALLVT